ncbi:methyltransferase [Nocardia sp. NPDC052278]|uniref:methyltransferase n=1 Tax=unclassified Nocardia TaxID=2637762 RepID=UPI0036A64FE0
MAKLTRQAEQAHRQACQLVNLHRDLSEDEKQFVLDNYQESTNPAQVLDGAFFTPSKLALHLEMEVSGPRIIDLCAGIGHLAFACRNTIWEEHGGKPQRQLVCVERNPDFVQVGRKIVPEAIWRCADVLTLRPNFRPFDCAISNPPYGRHIRRATDAPGYDGSLFEYHVITAAARLARFGTFLVPQTSAPFDFSGVTFRRDNPSLDYHYFTRTTGIVLDGTSTDTTCFDELWHHRPPTTEIVTCDFTALRIAASARQLVAAAA